MDILEFKHNIYQRLHGFSKSELFETAVQGASATWTRGEVEEQLKAYLSKLLKAENGSRRQLLMLQEDTLLKLVAILAYYQVNKSSYTRLASRLLEDILKCLDK